jgi:hypothetical protein
METRAGKIQALRELADFLEAHENIPMPYLRKQYAFPADKEAMVEAIKGTGPWVKRYDSANFHAVKSFGPIELDLCISREQACVRKVVGLKHVEEVVTPAHDEEVVEWECDPILGGENGSQG